ncbi:MULTISPECIES: hypothetical protein [Corynebacterium]|uniref:hypothetical protein n=1 Tax=Corynebacterium TaxID=1716 RepID=UPI00114D0BEC|nr:MULTISPECIES: hypothetical protein [Corynebacterium]MCT1441852.1 hypothetical protein [Corynebacterium glucuronolyticum]MCT1562378.1 hypothetical protein [Corynebacterium glucuronolyticum]QRO83637.1 hypothetical protein I6J20_05905 [Corynebacterium glucuronolyticum]
MNENEKELLWCALELVTENRHRNNERLKVSKPDAMRSWISCEAGYHAKLDAFTKLNVHPEAERSAARLGESETKNPVAVRDAKTHQENLVGIFKLLSPRPLTGW